MDQNVKQNVEMVKQLMTQAEAEKKAALIQAGNKAHISVPIDYTADSGHEYNGTIIFRRPSSMDYVRVGAVKSDMIRLAGIRPITDVQTGRDSMAHVDPSIIYLLQALATIKILMVDCPEWFNDYDNSYDTDLVVHVYNRFESELLSFRQPPKDGPTGSGETSTGPDNVDGKETIRG